MPFDLTTSDSIICRDWIFAKTKTTHPFIFFKKKEDVLAYFKTALIWPLKRMDVVP
jgi:hypothetical protein